MEYMMYDIVQNVEFIQYRTWIRNQVRKRCVIKL